MVFKGLYLQLKPCIIERNREKDMMTLILCVVATVLWTLHEYVQERYTELATEFLNRFFESKNTELPPKGKLEKYRILDTTTNVLFHLALVLFLFNCIVNVYHYVSA